MKDIEIKDGTPEQELPQKQCELGSFIDDVTEKLGGERDVLFEIWLTGRAAEFSRLFRKQIAREVGQDR